MQGIIQTNENARITALENRADNIEDNIDSLENKSDLKVNKANIYNDLDKITEGFVLDARQGKVLADGQNVNSQSIATIQSSIAIIVNGDTVTTTIAAGQYVYIKNSTILSEGLYTANTAVPSGTVITSQNVSQYFAAVSNGGLNAIQQSLATGRSASTENPVSIGTGSFGLVTSISLPAGVYLVIGKVYFGTEATGRNIIFLTTDINSTSNTLENSTALNGRGNFECTVRFELSSPGTVYLKALQAVGSQSVYGFIEAIKLA